MSSHDGRVAIDIVLVDDNPADQEIARRVFGSRTDACRLHLVSDGRQALEMLEPSSLRPDLILLDINMPRLSGIEVLRRLKASEQLRHIPVLMLTTSALPSDVRDAYRLGTSSYILKPTDVPEFRELFEHLLHYWTQVATLPARTNREPGD